MIAGRRLPVKFVSVRDLRIKPGSVWELLREGEDLVLTSNGKPFALMIETDEGHLEKHLLELRRTRARMAVSRIRERARARGLDRLSPREIDSIIETARENLPD